MTIPDYQTLMLPVLKAATRGEIKVSDIIDSLAEMFGLTDEERAALLPSGRQTIFSNRTHWAKTYLVQAGLLESTRRGHFTVTARGRKVLAGNPTRLDKEYLKKFPEFAQFLNRRADASEIVQASTTDSGEVSSDQTPDEIIRFAATELDQALRRELLARIIISPPAFFEQLVISLLIGMGYGGSLEDAGRKLGKSGDGGVDGVIDQDSLGLDSIYVQAKRYAPRESRRRWHD